MAKWQQKYRVEWDATDGRSGGAERTVGRRETLLEMERFNCHAGEKDQGAVALVLDLAKLRPGQSPSGLGLGSEFQFSQEDFVGAMRVLRCVVEPLQTITAVLPGSKWSCFLSRIVLRDALSGVTNIYPPLKLTVFVDDLSAPPKKKNEELVELAERVWEKLTKEVEEKGSRLSITEGGKEGKRKMIASCRHLEEQLRECSKRGGVILAESVGDARNGL